MYSICRIFLTVFLFTSLSSSLSALSAENGSDRKEEVDEGWLPWYASPDGFRYERRFVGPFRREETRTIRPDGTIIYESTMDIGGSSFSVRNRPGN